MAESGGAVGPTVLQLETDRAKCQRMTCNANARFAFNNVVQSSAPHKISWYHVTARTLGVARVPPYMHYIPM